MELNTRVALQTDVYHIPECRENYLMSYHDYNLIVFMVHYITFEVISCKCLTGNKEHVCPLTGILISFDNISLKDFILLSFMCNFVFYSLWETILRLIYHFHSHFHHYQYRYHHERFDFLCLKRQRLHSLRKILLFVLQKDYNHYVSFYYLFFKNITIIT